MQFDGGCADVCGGLDLRFVGVDEEGDADACFAEDAGEISCFLLLPQYVQATFGGDFLAFFGHDADFFRPHAQGVFEHFFGQCHFEVDVGADGAGDLCDVVVFDVAAVFAQVQGDVVRAVGFGQQGGFERGRVACAARVAQGGDVVDIDS